MKVYLQKKKNKQFPGKTSIIAVGDKTCMKDNYLTFFDAWLSLNSCKWNKQLSSLMTKWTKWHVHPAKTQISLGIHPVWSESSLCAQWVAKDPSFLHADSEDWSD